MMSSVGDANRRRALSAEAKASSSAAGVGAGGVASDHARLKRVDAGGVASDRTGLIRVADERHVDAADGGVRCDW